MHLPIKIEEIHFGERDALHEFMKQDRSENYILDNSFVNPPRVRMEELRSGARFYIVGPKGSGKTTLLWHLKRANTPTKSKVVLFKSHLRKEDRDQLDRMIDTIVVEDQRSFRVEADYKTIWEWYILKNIVRLIAPEDIVEEAPLFNDIAILLEADKNRFNTLYDSFNIETVKGKVKLKFDAGALKSEIGAEIAARRNESNRVSLLDLVRLVQASLPRIKLKPSASIRLYFDELEFFISDDGDGERDRRMVRDLLFSVYYINNIMSDAGLDVAVFASVRSEILHSIGGTNQELSKIIDAFGVNLDWFNESADNHPILVIFENKIRNSEILLTGAYTENVWKTYFPDHIDNREFRRYLLDSGMHRPRGVLLRLTAAAELAGSRTHFIEDDFNGSEKRFGSMMLEEFMDEISATYDESAREAIMTLFRGKHFAFNIRDIERRMNDYAGKNKSIKKLKDNLGPESLIRFLFRIGFIGNQFTNENGKTRQIWATRGENNPILEQRFVLHMSIRSSLSTL